MKHLLEDIAAKINAGGGCVASVETQNVRKTNGVWKRFVLTLATADGAAARPAEAATESSPARPAAPATPPTFARPLIAVVAPPARYPATVVYHRPDPAQTVGYTHEWGRDPNVVHPDNPPTIDNDGELQKVLGGLMELPETRQSLAAMAAMVG